MLNIRNYFQMSSKRKSDAKPPASKRGRKKKVDEDFDTDSDSDGANGKDLDASKKEVEVLIESTEDTKLPEELLKTFDREPGKLMVAGMVTWELTGRRDPKGKVTAIRPNLYVFHRFTDETVKYPDFSPHLLPNCSDYILNSITIFIFK